MRRLGSKDSHPGAAKALVHQLRSLSPEEARAHTIRHIAQQRTSAEDEHGLAAFLDKRPPSWATDRDQ